MKGLIYSWFMTRRVYFMVEAVLFSVSCIAMLSVLPHIDFGDVNIGPVVNFAAVFLGTVTIMCGAESLGKDLESMIKNRFADYALTSGLGKGGLAKVLLLRNLICLAISLAAGYALMFIYLFAGDRQPNAGLIMFVPFVSFLVHSVDYWVTPLVIKFKNAEKAGLALGAAMGLILLLYMLITRPFDSEGEAVMWFIFDFTAETIITCVLAASYVPVYIISLKIIKRGDLC